jgi:phage shock protein PspC (stress-responsive transcriptional regulator)
MPDGGAGPRGATLSGIIDKEHLMSDIPTSPTIVSEPAEAERKLVRPTEGRVVAGVSAGLADYFGISPIVYRVAFAALVLLGGSGLILYVAAWLVIPDERRGVSIVEEAVRNRHGRPLLAAGVGLLGFGLVLALAGAHLWSDPGRAWIPALAVGLAIVWWQLQGRDREALAVAAASAANPPVTGSGEVVPAQPVPRRRIPVVAPALGVIIGGAGILGILQATHTADVNWTVALAAGVVVIGVAVAVGAFFGGVGWLAALGVGLAMILIAVATIDIPLRGPVGDRTVEPPSVSALHERYRQSIGNLQLDLGQLAFGPGRTTLHASVGVGRLAVTVPRDVRVETTANVGLGNSEILGSQDAGWSVDRTVVSPGGAGAAATVVLDLDVGVGTVEVKRS